MHTLASSDEHGLRARSCKALRAIRDLSPSIAPKQIVLAVDLTVSLADRQYKYSRRHQINAKFDDGALHNIPVEHSCHECERGN
jgi:hypothetical protein